MSNALHVHDFSITQLPNFARIKMQSDLLQHNFLCEREYRRKSIFITRYYQHGHLVLGRNGEKCANVLVDAFSHNLF